MSTSLTEQTCIPCSGKVPPASEAEVAELKPQIPEWDIISANDVPQLQRVYNFSNFQIALDFTNKVGELAEADQHHPALLTEWGKVTVTWWTHALNGLHRNDFIMAAKTDEAAKGLASDAAAPSHQDE
ncbi:4a-hydroxytetrahydrobiopterin dehydratase [Leptolyngbya cf. ectocarpi LEGE 11479]|uniref:Putative pterin-4-alpha-carbinolamine dehydratase n=1 Tax=Leptolyngbya cf. ectocarpi LEGE 11479 TaxID=1828722 RepID=A0A929FAF2_LEPEC|nr:4a-hydroxytetrahydrobiopterin dehydratase [Leptolyngbya ectocarpi]MBE9068377.1 4a-hydroxytetrahydrobiopterin dehydratase [Leptolyngbya cf. ectocarpi LEGE 11479]